MENSPTAPAASCLHPLASTHFPSPCSFLLLSLIPSIHTSESQQEFFRMLDEKIEKGRDYCSEEEDVT
ncbi:hypothetical protein Z043_113002 [Scleropages formosus]|uniref:Uncharacterized protein n=1 Tax=Scleropages formosus TaxID=113540 RepID=A0A0N8JZ47_SCLFO|nr:hypothetical protein Z043_113002 [Scleropages formosus]